MLERLRHQLTTLRRAEDGAVAIEFVLLAPLLFALLFGILCVAYAIGINHSVHQLATSAARASLDGLNYTERQAEAEAYLSTAVTQYPLLDSSALSWSANVAQSNPPHIKVAVIYDLDTSILSIANGFLGLDISQIQAGAYLAY